MDKLVELAELMFPEIKETIGDLEAKYPPRNLIPSAEVTRFAPSPTGYLHTGSLFTSLVSYSLAKSTKGVFFLRLEDTDTKREIKGAGEMLLRELKNFKIVPDEGYAGDDVDKGILGPYMQSRRAKIYKIVIKELVKKGLAYPCFCTPEELEEIREVQEASKQIPGYYGSYAKCRYLTPDEAINLVKSGKPYVVRFKSHGNHNNKIRVHDEIRGDIDIAENDIDVVILKSDGLPTYHFAHVVDDHFMGTTTVTRGEEWISSLPIHVEMFKALNWRLPKYAHLPLIQKLDNGNKRKLSKRKDPEAAVNFFFEQGYPVEGVLIYLMSIANSNFEQWTLENKSFDLSKFKFSLSKMSLDGALFDLNKLAYFAKEFLATLSAQEMSKRALEYANKYQPALADLIKRDEAYFTKIMNIERDKENPRKDYAKFSDIYPIVRFFYDDEYQKIIQNGYPFNPNIKRELIAQVLTDFIKSNDYSLNEADWFNSLKALGAKYGFAANRKDYKANPSQYVGMVSDVAEMLRIALTGNKNSPNLYYILHILSKETIENRIKKAIGVK
ncbi:MAG: glutamate--tRNA ligase [Bacilli bacterium]|nr:glutamate--tRNA ligase [Bacilli bacterium]